MQKGTRHPSTTRCFRGSCLATFWYTLASNISSKAVVFGVPSGALACGQVKEIQPPPWHARHGLFNWLAEWDSNSPARIYDKASTINSMITEDASVLLIIFLACVSSSGTVYSFVLVDIAWIIPVVTFKVGRPPPSKHGKNSTVRQRPSKRIVPSESLIMNHYSLLQNGIFWKDSGWESLVNHWIFLQPFLHDSCRASPPWPRRCWFCWPLLASWTRLLGRRACWDGTSYFCWDGSKDGWVS